MEVLGRVEGLEERVVLEEEEEEEAAVLEPVEVLQARRRWGHWSRRRYRRGRW